MLVYAGIDEAGYGPLLGPLVVGRTALVLDAPVPTDPDGLPDLWELLGKAVARNLRDRRGRIAVNDSKKLHTSAAGIKHLELSCLAFASLAGHKSRRLDQLLDALGEESHRQLAALPWYAPAEGFAWDRLPSVVDEGELTIAGSMLRTAAKAAGVEAVDLGAATVFEDRFNRMVNATHSKAATSFTFVASHLAYIWQNYAEHQPVVVVDRQSGRSHYRDQLAMNFPDVQVDILAEEAGRSSYRLHKGGLAMLVSFQTQAEQQHLPVALASMYAKYLRELLMGRLNRYFAAVVPDLKPTAGYTQDGRRFMGDLAPHLDRLGIRAERLCRIA